MASSLGLLTTTLNEIPLFSLARVNTMVRLIQFCWRSLLQGAQRCIWTSKAFFDATAMKGVSINPNCSKHDQAPIYFVVVALDSVQLILNRFMSVLMVLGLNISVLCSLAEFHVFLVNCSTCILKVTLSNIILGHLPEYKSDQGDNNIWCWVVKDTSGMFASACRQTWNLSLAPVYETPPCWGVVATSSSLLQLRMVAMSLSPG